MIAFPPGTWIEIDSHCYPEYKTAEALQYREAGGFIVNLYRNGMKTQQTIIFNSEVVGMVDDGQSPSDIVDKLKKRIAQNTSTASGGGTPGSNPATVDPKVLQDAMSILKKKIEEKVPDAKKVKDPIEAYDRAMKGVM